MEFFNKHSLNIFHRLEKMIDYTECDHDGVIMHWLSKHFYSDIDTVLPYTTYVDQSHLFGTKSNIYQQADQFYLVTIIIEVKEVISAFFVVTVWLNNLLFCV